MAQFLFQHQLFQASASGSLLSNSSFILLHNSIDYNKYLLSQTHTFSSDKPLLPATVDNHLSLSGRTQTFQK
ncbi:unnamed protein product [Rotaria magnacalcarata]|uniref:Uncharacterized protein n=2 Tax=Rotaria magnacalcarata TaxID=392030 RepID=A0A819M674_9BILA|nr:unnamed protein product [Rotaria magnacalcarata]CAF3975059.1 unnamed protein product [Rotaria magnacalcarata]